MGNPVEAITQANPGFALGGLPKPQPGAAITRMYTVRAQQPGGALMEYAPSDKVLWFEQLYRKLPPDGMFGARPNKPVVFAMGAFRVPQSMVLVVIDYSFNIYRFSGAAAGDFVPLEENRLSTQVGWDILVDASRPANLNFQIIPQVQSQQQPVFQTIRPGTPAQQWQFDEFRALQNQIPAGPAGAMMPQRHHRDGLVQLSNSYVARSGSVFSVRCNIINQIPIPIAFFEANVCGMLLPQNVYDAYQNAAIPTGDPVMNPVPGGA